MYMIKKWKRRKWRSAVTVQVVLRNFLSSLELRTETAALPRWVILQQSSVPYTGRGGRNPKRARESVSIKGLFPLPLHPYNQVYTLSSPPQPLQYLLFHLDPGVREALLLSGQQHGCRGPTLGLTLPLIRRVTLGKSLNLFVLKGWNGLSR